MTVPRKWEFSFFSDEEFNKAPFHLMRHLHHPPAHQSPLCGQYSVAIFLPPPRLVPLTASLISPLVLSARAVYHKSGGGKGNAGGPCVIRAICVPRLSSRAPRKLQRAAEMGVEEGSLSLSEGRNCEAVYLSPLHFYPHVTVACVECLGSWRVNVYLTRFCPSQ